MQALVNEIDGKLLIVREKRSRAHFEISFHSPTDREPKRIG
jgi:hypothetical protein